MAEWTECGAPIERDAPMIRPSGARSGARENSTRHFSWLEILANWPLDRLVGFWLGMIVVFGVIYWLAGISMGWGLQAGTAEVKPDELRGIFDPIQVVQENLIDVGPCVSQRILEAQGGRLDVKQGRAEVSFAATLPGALL